MFNGNDTHHKNGIGILLSPTVKKSLLNFKSISDKIISARLHSKFSNIQCYAPIENEENAHKDAHYIQLEACLLSYTKSDIKICMGDGNAKVGCAQP